jgi:hypothetical protein
MKILFSSDVATVEEIERLLCAVANDEITIQRQTPLQSRYYSVGDTGAFIAGAIALLGATKPLSQLIEKLRTSNYKHETERLKNKKISIRFGKSEIELQGFSAQELKKLQKLIQSNEEADD